MSYCYDCHEPSIDLTTTERGTEVCPVCLENYLQCSSCLKWYYQELVQQIDQELICYKCYADQILEHSNETVFEALLRTIFRK